MNIKRLPSFVGKGIVVDVSVASIFIFVTVIAEVLRIVLVESALYTTQ